MIDGNDLPPTTDQDVIGSATSVEDILSALAARNCPDLTSAVNMATCGNLPITGGGFCDVYQGTMNLGSKIAIKSLRLYDKPGREDEKEKLFKRAARELYHWSKLKHHNILPLMGLAMFRGRLSMISEWMENGSLMSYILRNHPSDINRIGLCVDVCSGLSYLHKNYMVHGDLKAANVMVSSSGIGMIADFGNSQLKEITLRFTNTTSSSLSAPELFTTIDKPQVSKESDVYAYGMTVLETLTGRVPYDGVGDRKVLALVALSRQTPARPTTAMSDEIWEILQLCWRWEPSDRPDMSVIEERLRDIYFRSWIGAKQTDNPEVSQFTYTGTLAASTNSRTSHAAELQGMLRLAMKYREDGRLAEAGSLGAEILTTQKRVLGVEHPDTLAAMADLAATYRKQGQWVEAEGLEIEEVAFRKQVLGGDHPETISCIANLASRYHEQGRLAEAEPFWAEVVAAQKQTLGEGHPDTLVSMASLARIYHSQGRAAEAEPLWTEVVAARNLLLGEDHPDTLSSMANLAIIYHDQGRLAEAEPILTKVVVAQKQALGAQHPDTLSSVIHLAFNRREQGQWAKAESLEIEVLAFRKLLLGEDHPDTLSSTENLATICEKQGRLAEAEELQSKVVTGRRLFLGGDDPKTHESMTKLASIYRKQGRQAEAENLEKQAISKEWNEGLASELSSRRPYYRRTSAGNTPPYRTASPEPPSRGLRRFRP